MAPERSTPKPPPAGGSEAPRPLRADARRNRERLLIVAAEVFSERGADASMEDIARRAGVGIGTLYRHFPTREALLAATVEEHLLALARKTRALAASAPPGDGFAEFMAAFVEHASTYRGLAASLGVVFQCGSPGCIAATEAATHLLSLAQAAGEIRCDVTVDDIVGLVTAISVAAQQPPADPARAQRLLTTFIAGLRAPSSSERAASSSRRAPRAREGHPAPAAGRDGATASAGSGGQRSGAIRRR
ncbi:TetR/AcrR family transcriptional regulator [Sorangium sp. So ce887]|uniref:TetR/AcrR family transcriptional regulator n=1 Tax=Sorangium sp. So ce887 TaxID=3133324 RepID=UPI003F5EF252